MFKQFEKKIKNVIPNINYISYGNTSQDQSDDQRLIVQIVDDAGIRFDKRPSEVYPLTGVPSANLRQSLFVHFNHVQFEVRPKPLVVELYDAGQTAYFYLYV